VFNEGCENLDSEETWHEETNRGHQHTQGEPVLNREIQSAEEDREKWSIYTGENKNCLER